MKISFSFNLCRMDFLYDPGKFLNILTVLISYL